MCNTPKYAKLEERTGELYMVLKYSNNCKRLHFIIQYDLFFFSHGVTNFSYVSRSVGS